MSWLPSRRAKRLTTDEKSGAVTTSLTSEQLQVGGSRPRTGRASAPKPKSRWRHTILAAVVGALVAWLLLREAPAWVSFDWRSLGAHLRNVRIRSAIFGMVLIYLAYALRALRWSVLMKRLDNPGIGPLLRATFIGFGAMALLGRPAEMIRPYLISRQTGTSMSSQVAIWALERIFDGAAFLTLVSAALLVSQELRALPQVAVLGRAALVLACAVGLGGLLVLFAVRDPEQFGARVGRFLAPLSPELARRSVRFSSGIVEGASAVRDPALFAQAAVLSVLMWGAIAYAYMEVIHGFPEPLRSIGFPSVLLLIGFSLLGSIVQLPAGGTSQLMSVAALSFVFRVPTELAVSCGIVVWLTTYMAPVPVGLALLQKEHLSLKSLALRSGAVSPSKIGSQARSA